MNERISRTNNSLEIVETRVSQDGSVKYLFGTKDQRVIEGIYFPFAGLFNRTHIQATVLCLSSQVGCPVGCEFCATGKILGPRNLSLPEISEQYRLVSEDVKSRGLESVDSLAMMGMGEPLLNLRNVLTFADEVAKIDKIKRFSVSTVGIIPRIRAMKETNPEIKLYLSVHTPFNKQRELIIPVSKTYPIEEVVKESASFAEKGGAPVVANYILIKGVNDSREHVEALSELLDSDHFDVQLNIWNEIPGTQFQQSDITNLNMFADVLTKKGYTVDVQLSKGTDIAGGCGQFSAQKD